MTSERSIQRDIDNYCKNCSRLADQKQKIFLWFHNWLIQKELNMKLKDWSSTELKRDFDKEFEELK